MHTLVITLTAFALGGQMTWYGGGVLPVLSIIIQENKSNAVKNFFRWCRTFLLSALLIGLVTGIIGPYLFPHFVPLSNNILMIGFGLWMLIRVVRTNTPLEQSQIKTLILSVALIQGVLVCEAASAVYSIKSSPTFLDTMIAVICFILSVLIHSAIISFILWLIASTSKTKKLQRYLAGLFAFLCIVIGTLNFL
jgi:hypothetical protein